jgi:hypothetical protein
MHNERYNVVLKLRHQQDWVVEDYYWDRHAKNLRKKIEKESRYCTKDKCLKHHDYPDFLIESIEVM